MTNCTGNGDGGYHFKCRMGSCIHPAGRCDGRVDCADASDEYQCRELLLFLSRGYSYSYCLTLWLIYVGNFFCWLGASVVFFYKRLHFAFSQATFLFCCLHGNNFSLLVRSGFRSCSSFIILGLLNACGNFAESMWNLRRKTYGDDENIEIFYMLLLLHWCCWNWQNVCRLNGNATMGSAYQGFYYVMGSVIVWMIDQTRSIVVVSLLYAIFPCLLLLPIWCVRMWEFPGGIFPLNYAPEINV